MIYKKDGKILVSADGKLCSTCCSVVSDYASVWKLNSSGVLQWTYDTGNTTHDIAVDGSGNIYLAGTRNNNIDSTYRSVWKLNSAGVLQWGYDTGSHTHGIAVDGSGNVYVTGYRNNNIDSTYRSVWKLNSAGVLQWGYDTGDASNAVTYDGAGNVYIVGEVNISGKTAWKLNSAGSLQWDYSAGSSHADSVGVDGSGNVYIGADRTNKCIWKLNSSGVLQWDYDAGSYGWEIIVSSNIYLATGDKVYNFTVDGDVNWYSNDHNLAYIALDSSNNVFAVDDGLLYRLASSDGSDDWSYDTGSIGCRDVAADGTSALIAGYNNGSASVWKINSSGSKLWDYDTSGTTSGVCIDGSNNVCVCGVRVLL